MASVKGQTSGDGSEDEKTDSSKACLLLEIATILSVATANPMQLGVCLGISNTQVAEINASLEDQKNKVIHLLERFRDRHGDHWQKELEGVVREKLENPDLAKEIQSVKLRQKRDPIGESQKSPRVSSGHSSGWEMASGSAAGSHSDRDDAHSSESFERLSEENVFALRDGEHQIKEESHHGSLDHPEMSLQIAKVGEALRTVSDLLGNVEGITQLTEVIPQILQLVRQMKSQKMLRLVFEEENSNLKQDLHNANEILRDLRETIERLESEVADLKKAAEDKSLKDFDYVTRKEAHEMKEEQKKVEEKQTSPVQATPQSSASEGVSIEAYEALQKKIITLKQKLAQVVKLNHSWDEQYHRMESALKQEIETSNQRNMQMKADYEKREKERDKKLVAAKNAVEKAEAEKLDLKLVVDQSKQQVTKMKRYAVSLQEHKQDLETEVKRLNEALEQKLQVTEKPKSAAPPPAHAAGKGKSQPKPGKKRDEKQLLSYEERSLLASMSQDALIEELGLLKQQVDVYKSDFYKEQRDRQRAMGELDEVKTELHRTKKKMDKQKYELQIVQDQALAYKFHAKEHNLGRPTGPPRQTRPSKKQAQPSPQANAYTGLHGPRFQQQYQKLRRYSDKDELVPHGGAVNYAMNDEYVDGMENLQVYYPPASDLSDTPQAEQDREDDPFYFEIP